MFTQPKELNESALSPQDSKILARELDKLTDALLLMGYVHSGRDTAHLAPEDIRHVYARKSRNQLSDAMSECSDNIKALTLMQQGAPITAVQRDTLARISSIQHIVTNYSNIVSENKPSR